MPPPAGALSHQPAEDLLRGRVERGGRLVQEPERAVGDQQPRQRHPAPLAGGEIGDRQARPRGRARPRRALRGASRRARRAVACAKARFSSAVSGALQGVPVADQCRRSAEVALADALRPDAPAVRLQPPGQDQRAGVDFPAPLRPVTTQGLARFDARRKAVENQAGRTAGRPDFRRRSAAIHVRPGRRPADLPSGCPRTVLEHRPHSGIRFDDPMYLRRVGTETSHFRPA